MKTYISAFIVCIINFPVYSQHKSLDFSVFKIELVDNLAKIGLDSLYNVNIDTAKFNLLFYESYKHKEFGSVYILNQNQTEYFRLNSSQTDGYWNDFFTIGILSEKIDNFLQVANEHFTSHDKIKLGITDTALLNLVNKEPDCILEEKDLKILKYYWIDTNSLSYKAWKIPSYVASFKFKNSKLIKFGFGRYLAELDQEFYPRNFKLSKGKLYKH